MEGTPRGPRERKPPHQRRRHRMRTSRCRTLSRGEEGDGATAPPAAARAQRFYHKYEHRPMISYIFIDEVGFNLVKRRRWGRNVIGQRDIVEAPGQRVPGTSHCVLQ
ncbi:unnamed protein product [Pleuronectes platessa]|uniref:Uncharacterized protein n=1 Tax=Pleuronectes platessa TaxID=8262 RepID=A0A9N7YT73_PLEPL|nr:unnamed protein product [Pleuronectes platessa]